MISIQNRSNPETSCPNVHCDAAFACDACMHAHLVSRYGVGYCDAFGKTHEAFLHFCDRHASCSPAMLDARRGAPENDRTAFEGAPSETTKPSA